MSVEWNHRTAVLGRTGSGKSFAARAMFDSAVGGLKVIVDPNASSLTDVPGAITVPRKEARGRLQHDLDVDLVRAELDAALEQAGPAGVIRYVPADPFGGDEYQVVYAWAFDRAPVLIWTDEAGIVAPATGSPKAFRRVLVQGRKRQVGAINAHTRPRELDVNVIAQANHVLLFDIPHPDDQQHVARLIGIPTRELAAALDALGEFEFLWFDVAANTLTHCPALTAPA